MVPLNTPTRMRPFSIQVPEDLWAGLQGLAQRERKQLQPMLREMLQAIVDGDHPGRVVAAGTREAIDALRNEQRRRETALAQMLNESLESLGEEQQGGEGARAQIMIEAIESLPRELARGREEDQAERAALRTAVSDLQEGVAGLHARMETPLDVSTPSAPDEARPRLRNPFRGGGG